jgi:hypothetical protein
MQGLKPESWRSMIRHDQGRALTQNSRSGLLGGMVSRAQGFDRGIERDK